VLSSVVYLINDVVDAPRDRLHPRKQRRPIASGRLPVAIALRAAAILGVVGLAAAYLLSPYFGICALAYALLMTAYSLALKDVFLIDTMIIAMGFMIRAVSGVIVLRTPERIVPLTSWFVICVMFLSLLLAFCKRRSERLNLSDEAAAFRPVLACYGVELMDRIISVCAAGAILSYTLYATSTDHDWIMLTTLPFVLYGIFRYLHLVYTQGEGEAPELVLLRDPPLVGCVILWGLAMAAIYLYLPLT
jgi:4-hydroxybenzoate polyprenyltransferase